MPLKVIKTRIKAAAVLGAATSLATIIADVAALAQFPLAHAAARVVLVILETVQALETNKVACYKLARRAAKILLEMKQHMEGRWNSAPKALVENILSFEKMLMLIRDFMQELSEMKWMERLLQKGAIETSLNDYHVMLDDAEKSFQIASLIEIHYTVGILQQRSARSAVRFVENVTEAKLEEELPISSLPPHDESVRHPPMDLSYDSGDQSLVRKIQNLSTDKSDIKCFSTLDVRADDFDLQVAEELAELDNFGFKRYHQSDVRLRSTLKCAGPSSFWEGSSIADVDDLRVVVKQYGSVGDDKKSTMKKWLHDIKILRNLYHTNLPQIVGFSDEQSKTAFILLSHVKLRDPNVFLLNAVQSMSIAECSSIVLRMYRDVTGHPAGTARSAALYVQRQLSLDERETQVFVAEASYSLDVTTGNMIVGIPPPRNPNSFHGFSYRLTESLTGTVLQTLPKAERFQSLAGTMKSLDVVNMQNKLVHVKALVLDMLPKAGQSPTLEDFAEELLEDASEEDGAPHPPLSLIRARNIGAGAHDFAWHEGIHSCPISFAIGDVGYISRSRERVQMTDKSRFDDFVKIGNVFKGVFSASGREGGGGRSDDTAYNLKGMEIVRDVTAQQNQWFNGFHRSYETWPFVLPESVEGWSVSLPPQGEIGIHVRHSEKMASVNEAWHYLVREAEHLARESDVEPHEIILITRTISGQIYRVRDFRPPPFKPFGNVNPPHPTGHHFGGPGFGQIPPHTYGAPGFAHANLYNQQMPQMLFLFTSYRPDFKPFWADNPSAVMMPEHMRRDLRSISQTVAWPKPEAIIDYIQLSEEDFS